MIKDIIQYYFSQDPIVKTKFQLAKKGLKAWKNIWKKVEFQKNDVIVFLPDSFDTDETVYALSCLPLLEQAARPENIWFISTIQQIKKVLPLFCPKASFILIDRNTSHCMMSYVLMTEMEENIYIASFTEPYGRWGDRLINSGTIGPEQCFATGIYHIFGYKPIPLPKYSGTDEYVLSFLARATELRRRSEKIDEKAFTYLRQLPTKEICQIRPPAFDEKGNFIKVTLKKIKFVKLLQFYYCHLLQGERKIRYLKKKYGDKTYIYINHYPGTGDTSLTSAFLSAWNTKKHVGKYVVTVVGDSAEKVAKLYSLQNVERLTFREAEDILHFVQTVGETNPSIDVLHFEPSGIKNRIIWYLLGVNGNNFMQMFLHIVFPGLSLSDMEKPQFVKDEKEVELLFNKNGLREKETIILVPYANTIDPLPDIFWKKLAKGLKEEGYCICTNCDYPREKNIEGTIPVFLSYDLMQVFLQKAGYIIQLRSGLTDLLYDCPCKNIVLYPKENSWQFGQVSLYEYFSLHNMGLSDDAIEIEFSRKEVDSVCQDIITMFR